MYIRDKHPFSYILTSRYKIRLLKKMIKPKKNASLLEIGCGSGFALSQLEDMFDKVVGIDLSKKALSLARKYIKAKLLHASGEKLPFKNSSFDYVISLDVFEHIKNDKKAVKEVHKVLKKNACFIIYVPSSNGILSNTLMQKLFHQSNKNYLKDYRSYSRAGLMALVQDSGLKVKNVGYHNIFFQELFTQVLKWFSWKIGKRYKDQSDIVDFVNVWYFPLYCWLLLPIIDILVFIEEFIFKNIFNSQIPGHRIILKAEK